jgi:uncharacterized protein YkwD
MRRLVVALLSVLSLAAFAGGAAYAADYPADALAQINAYRAENGLKPLRLEARLSVMSRAQARDMIEKQYFGTRGPTGTSLETRLRDAGYAFRQAAQQVAVGYPDGRSVVANWIRRGDSRQVLLSRKLSEAGIGYAERGSGSLDHYWVITLAEPTHPVSANWRSEVLRLVNKFRARYGLKPLKLNDELNRTAQGHSDDMAEHDYFDHVTPNGQTVGDRATAAGYHWRTILENIAAGQQDPAEVVAGWIHSPAHREAMLAPDVDDAGIGYRYLARDGGRTRQYHYWTLNMGRQF